MLKKDSIVRITFPDTEITLLQKQQLYVIKSLSYKINYLALNNSMIFRFSPNSEKMVNLQLLDIVTE